MKVRVRSERYLSDDELMSIEDNKRRWWLIALDTNYGEGEFINLWKQGIGKEDTIANRPMDLILDLEPGRYLAGCGDKNVINSRGYPTRQLLNFIVFPNGTVDYYSYKDMPSLADFQQMVLDDPTLSEPPKEADITVSPQFSDYKTYPEDNQRWCKFKDTFVDDNDTCDFVKPKSDSGGTLCDNCVQGVVLYYNPADETDE